MTKKYKVYIDRSACIACDTCSSILPKIFKMNDDDGLVDTKGSKQERKHWVLEINASQLEEFQQVSDSCPTEVFIIKK